MAQTFEERRSGDRRSVPRKAGKRRPRKRARRQPYGGFWGFVGQYFRQLRYYMVTGLLVWVPLIFTAWVTWWLIWNVGGGIESFMKRWVEKLASMSQRFPSFEFLGEVDYVPGTGFGIAIVLFLTTGFLTKYLVTRKVIASGEQIVARIPLINRVYVAAQQIRDVYINREGSVFQSVVLIEYPRKGVYVVGFLTSKDQGILQHTAGKELMAIFVPTTPNPTSGFLLYLQPEELVHIDISVEDAMKLIVSAGAYLPQRLSKLADAAAKKEQSGRRSAARQDTPPPPSGG